MAQLLSLRFSDCKRPLWLVLALAAAIMVGLSSPGAQARPVGFLLQTLERDLGALRAQIEQVVARPSQPGAAMIAFNADLGDGGTGFHRTAMAATLRTAQRSAALLEQRFREQHEAKRLELAQRLALGLQVLERSLVAMRDAPEAAGLELAWSAAEGELRALERIVAALGSHEAAGTSRPGQAMPPA